MTSCMLIVVSSGQNPLHTMYFSGLDNIKPKVSSDYPLTYSYAHQCFFESCKGPSGYTSARNWVRGRRNCDASSVWHSGEIDWVPLCFYSGY